jgi:hypothetical protein
MGPTSRKGVHMPVRLQPGQPRKDNIRQVPADRLSSSTTRLRPNSNNNTTNIKTSMATVMTNMEMVTTRDMADNTTI